MFALVLANPWVVVGVLVLQPVAWEMVSYCFPLLNWPASAQQKVGTAVRQKVLGA
jgi:hypothetical protein